MINPTPSAMLSLPPTQATDAGDFSLTTTWRLAVPLQRVWAAIEDAGNWPAWWPYVTGVTLLEPGNGTGLGSARRFHWRTALPYTLSFEARVVALRAPFAIDAQVSGDLTGMGRWRLSRAAGMTLARYHWEVSAAKPWMRRLAPLARPLFEWNHRRVMQKGGEGLAAWQARTARID
jgi:Polyketide cyclase / dehydrase and lipid transport